MKTNAAPGAPAADTAGKTSTELRQERKKVNDQIDAIQKKAADEKRQFTADEQIELRKLLDSATEYTTNIELTLELEKRSAIAAGKEAGKSAGLSTNPSESEEKEMRGFSISKMVKEYCERDGKVTGLEAELIEESEKEARALGVTPSGIYLSNKVMNVVHQRTMTAGSATAGGNFIPTEKVGFFDALYAKTVLAELGVVSLTGLSANTDLTGFSAGVSAGWAAETGTQSPSDATTASRSPRPKLLYAATDISKQLIIQTNDSIDAYIMNSMMRAMAVAFEAAVINGDGSNKPTGILGTSGIQDVAIGTNGGAPTLAKILELVQTVETAGADLRDAKFLINPKTKAKLKQTTIDSGSGAMIMAYQQYFSGTPDVIDGRFTSVTSNVPSTLTKGTSTGVCSAIIFGDFSQVVTAQYGGVDLMIDNVSAAIVRTGKVALTINQYVDSVLKQPAALGAILDVTTT